MSVLQQKFKSEKEFLEALGVKKGETVSHKTVQLRDQIFNNATYQVFLFLIKLEFI